MKEYLHELEDKNGLDRNDLLRFILVISVLGVAYSLLAGAALGLLQGIVLCIVIGIVLSIIWPGVVMEIKTSIEIIIILFLVFFCGSIVGLGTVASIKYLDPSAEVITTIIVTILIIAEIIFLFFDKTVPKKKDNRFWFTVKRKILAYWESLYIIMLLNGLYQGVIRGYPYIGYLVVGLIGLILMAIIFYGYIKLNSLKYRKKKARKQP